MNSIRSCKIPLDAQLVSRPSVPQTMNLRRCYCRRAHSTYVCQTFSLRWFFSKQAKISTVSFVTPPSLHLSFSPSLPSSLSLSFLSFILLSLCLLPSQMQKNRSKKLREMPPSPEVKNQMGFILTTCQWGSFWILYFCVCWVTLLLKSLSPFLLSSFSSLGKHPWPTDLKCPVLFSSASCTHPDMAINRADLVP